MDIPIGLVPQNHPARLLLKSASVYYAAKLLFNLFMWFFEIEKIVCEVVGHEGEYQLRGGNCFADLAELPSFWGDDPIDCYSYGGKCYLDSLPGFIAPFWVALWGISVYIINLY